MVTMRVSTRGRVVIPAELRRRLGFRAGTLVDVSEHEGAVLIRLAMGEQVDKLVGIFKGKGSLCEELLRERAEDREREDRKAPMRR